MQEYMRLYKKSAEGTIALRKRQPAENATIHSLDFAEVRDFDPMTYNTYPTACRVNWD